MTHGRLISVRVRSLVATALCTILFVLAIWPIRLHRWIGTGWAVVVVMFLAVGAWIFLIRAILVPGDAPSDGPPKAT